MDWKFDCPHCNAEHKFIEDPRTLKDQFWGRV
jgi:hypothetical protein